MTCHGFGMGKVRSTGVTPAQIKAIARCISTLTNITWAHVIHSSRLDYDIIFEMKGKCDKTAINACVQEIAGPTHTMDIHEITVEEESYVHGRKGKHPKAVD
jgi:hypothetical protein